MVHILCDHHHLQEGIGEIGNTADKRWEKIFLYSVRCMNQEKCLLRDSRLVSNWAAWCISEGPQWNHTDELSRGIRDCHSTDKFEQC